MLDKNKVLEASGDVVAAGLGVASVATAAGAGAGTAAAMTAVATFGMALQKLINVVRPDMSKVVTDSMREQIAQITARIVHLHEAYERAEERSDEAPTPEEIIEITTQTIQRMANTASVEKRRAMTCVLANGLEGGATAAELRYFLRAIDEMDVDHIEIMATGDDPKHDGYVVAPPGDLGLGLLEQLRSRHFIAPKATTLEDYFANLADYQRGSVGDGIIPDNQVIIDERREHIEADRMVALTDLGRRFLDFLIVSREPSPINKTGH